MKLTVNLGENSYPIYIENGILTDAGSYISKLFTGKRIMVISDDHVFPLYGQQLLDSLKDYECHPLVLSHGEPTKSFETLPRIYEALLDARLTRSDLVIALGGGVIGDLAGFAAASYLRGVKLVQIPTSLLAQVDSSVGGKVAVDLPQGKNLVGAFYHPKLVLIDPLVLESLPPHFISDGMGEVIKYGCIRRPALFDRLLHEDVQEHLEEVIYECVDCKRQVVEADALDKGERMILNFGHTLGHALEKLHGFSGLSHGEAVGIGMVLIAKAGERAGLTAPGTSEKIAALLEKYHLPTKTDWSIEQIAEATALDKKSAGKNLRLILLHDIGDAYIYTIPAADLQMFLS